MELMPGKSIDFILLNDQLGESITALKQSEILTPCLADVSEVLRC